MTIVFEPCCKFELIEFILLDEISSNKAAQHIAKVKENLSAWFNEILFGHNKLAQNSSSSASATNQHSVMDKNDDNGKSARYKKFLAGKKNFQPAMTTAKLDLYLQEPPVLVDIDSPTFSILAWLQVNKS
jgi:hypothetical protein